MRKDMELKPRLFFWEGSVDSQRLKQLLHEKGWALPGDLFDLLVLTGGGEIFESETILGPFRDADLGDNLFTYNEELRDRGLPDGYVVFHTGIAVSAVRLTDGRYVEFGLNDFEERGEYASLEDWYLRLIRAVYGEHYGLPPQPLSSS